MKYRKKLVVVEAEQFFTGVKPWPEGVWEATVRCVKPFVRTLEGDMSVNEGDWIITGVEGEKYPCNPSIFEKTYNKEEI